MAIVFISPQRRQRVLFFAVAGIFVLALLGIGLSVYLAKPETAKTEDYFVATPVRINWNVLKSDQLAGLEPIPDIKKEFQFKAKTAAGQDRTGIVSAASEEEARKALEALGLASIVINELKPGRTNPFSPYYIIGAQ